MIGYLICGDILIAIDLFSQKEGSLKSREIRVLNTSKPLKQQIYEAVSGNKWDETMERLDQKMEGKK